MKNWGSSNIQKYDIFVLSDKRISESQIYQNMVYSTLHGNKKVSEVRYMVYSTLAIKKLVEVEYTGLWYIRPS